MAENTGADQNIGTPVAATDPDTGDTLTYSLSGPDAGSFALVGQGQLQTKAALDHETTASYTVTISVRDSKDDSGTADTATDDTITVTINVTNEEEAGTVSLSPDPPTVDEVLTASLSDPDGGVTNLTWTWETSANSAGPWTTIDGETAATYTPVADDARQYLRATASYGDDQGTGRSAQAVSAEVRSINADLSAIRVNGTAIAGFDPATPSYIVGVASTTTQATLSASPADPNATVAYSVDGTDVTGNPQVTFTTTDNSFDITITVTAADGMTTEEYTVTVRRGVTTALGWKVDDDIDLSANSAPRGVWSNGTTLWAVDATANKLFAYTLATQMYDSVKDIPLDGANTDPTGIWSDGTTIWVADATANKLFAYTLATRLYDADKDIELAANTEPTDIWSDGTTFWVADATDTKLFAYTLKTGSSGSSRDFRATGGKSGRLPRLTDVDRDADKDIDLDTANADPTGIWSDGVTIWVADDDDDTLYAYTLETGSRDRSKDFTDPRDAGNTSPFGLWSDGVTMWGADSDDAKLFSYTLPVSDNAELRGILVNGEAASGSVTSYSHTVDNGIAQATVEPQALQRKATATVTAPLDANTGTAGHQVNLDAGDNTVAITVTAQDRTEQAYTLTIHRTNSPPKFQNDRVTRSVTENTGPNVVNIGTPIEEATDDDGNALTYSFGGTDAASFTFDTATRQLKTKTGVTYDYEMPVDANADNNYEVTVTATDDLGAADTLNVTISVTNVNEPAEFTDMTATRSVAENTGADQNIGTPVAATDPDTTGLEYSLGGTDVSSFAIDESNGQLRTKDGVTYDYETKNSYKVIVFATDGNQAVAATIEVTITVTDVDEAGTVSLDPPQALTPLAATLADEDASAAQLRDAGWQWARSDNSTGPWTPITGETEASYTPQAGDVGKHLRAIASYEDRHHTASNPTPSVSAVSAQVQDAPQVELVLDPATINEDGGTSTVTATLTGGTTSSGDTVVTLVDPPEFDLSGTTTLTIPAGETTSDVPTSLARTVTLTAEDNDVDHDASRTVDVTGTTPNPQVTGPDAAQLTITDDDERGVTLSLNEPLNVPEGGEKTYTLVLESEPTAEVTVTVATTLGSSEDVSVQPPSLTFTAANWDDEQMVTVEAAHDSGDGDQDDTATITHTVSGGDYEGFSVDDVEVTVEDDEAESTAVELTVDPTVGENANANPNAVEVTVTGTLNGNLRSTPTEVTVSVASGTATEGEDFTVSNLTTLMIGAGHLSGTATFTLTLTDDTIDEPNETVRLTGSTTATVEGNPSQMLTVRETALTITDNDRPPGVELVLTSDSIAEDGGTSTVTAKLTGGTTSSVDTVVELTEMPGVFSLTPSATLTIPAGETTSSGGVTLTAVDNDEFAPHRTVTVSGSVTYDLPGTPTLVEKELTITDDERPTVRSTDAARTTYHDYAYTEGERTPVDTYKATNPDLGNIRITWRLEGDDAEQFTIDETSGELRFKHQPPDFPGTPDYEDRQDTDTNNRYEVTVIATATEGTTTRDGSQVVTVEVVDAPGELSLLPASPRIGQEVRVRLEDRVDDIDTSKPVTWVWEWTTGDPEDPNAKWTSLNNATTDTYTPERGDVHRFLRVTATYTDGDGTGPKPTVPVISDGPVTVPDSPLPPPGPSGPPSGPPGGGPGGGPPVEERPDPVGYLENPGPDSFQSGIGLISGWVCEAESVEIEIETAGGEVKRLEAAYGTERLDTARRADGTPLCGDTDNGFGLLFNWNRLGEGEHTVVAYVDDVELGRAVVRVTTVGEGAEEEFLRGAEGECVVDDFPMPGETVTLEWQQNSQNFVITDAE